MTESPSATTPSRSLVLLGFMGAGKTTAARIIAEALGVEALDSDSLIERELGTDIQSFFAEQGEAAFRAVEQRVVGDLLERANGQVLALGGGSLTSQRVRERLRRHLAVLLEIDADLAWYRSKGGRRPLARDREAFLALHAERSELYLAAADAVLPAGGIDRVRRALPALLALRAAPSGSRMLWAHAASGDYPVFVGEGVLGTGLAGASGRAFLVSDENVGPLYADRVGPVTEKITIPAGEPHKTLREAERVWRALAAAGMTRDDHLIALGGGVVGDLAGFCAATYQRGVEVVQAPTTLVAQVDAAYGGKTGVDLPEGKNYVGAYHQPAAVVVDPEVLQTLPDAELAAGYAEVIKTALIAGGSLWERVRAGTQPDGDMIFACARAKLAIVASDERDAGGRQALNLGHTIAHAIETATEYGRYRHGEAVGLGLLAALRLSGLPELRDAVARLLVARGLPTKLDDGIDPEQVIVCAQRDKKRAGGPGADGARAVGYVLLDAPGKPRIGCTIAADELRAAVTELLA